MNTNNAAFASANAQYTVLAWEPVAHSGEKINVGAIIQFNQQIIAKPLIRGDLLRCMYGAAGDGVVAMITRVLAALTRVSGEPGLEEITMSDKQRHLLVANITALVASSALSANHNQPEPT